MATRVRPQQADMIDTKYTMYQQRQKLTMTWGVMIIMVLCIKSWLLCRASCASMWQKIAGSFIHLSNILSLRKLPDSCDAIDACLADHESLP